MKRFITLSAALVAVLALCTSAFAKPTARVSGPTNTSSQRIQLGQTTTPKLTNTTTTQGLQTQLLQNGKTNTNQILRNGQTNTMQTQIIKNLGTPKLVTSQSLRSNLVQNQQMLCKDKLKTLCCNKVDFKCYLHLHLGCHCYFQTCPCFWSQSCYSPSYCCTLYYDPIQCIWFYYCVPYQCYLPVEFCPCGTYVF
jgi:hypothetical protein